MSILKRYSTFAIAIFLISCAESPPADKASSFSLYQELIIPESKGIFRGHNVADTPEVVSGKEAESAIFASDSLIQYQFNFIGGGDTLDVDLYYAFDTFGLFEIQSDIYTSNESDNTVWMDQLKNGLTGQFGDAEPIGKIYRWTTSSPSNNIIEISLGEERDEDGISFISLNMLEPLENEL